MAKQVLDKRRAAMLRKLAVLKPLGALGGGTALALQLKHRISYDFDILALKPIPSRLLSQLEHNLGGITPLLNTKDELTVAIGSNMKLSVVYFPFPPKQPFVTGYPLPLWSVTDIGGNKAYAIGRRGTYRDYVDVYAILKSGHTLDQIVGNATERFGDKFNERLFLQQLNYLEDLDDLIVEWLWPRVSAKTVSRSLNQAVVEHLANAH